MSGWNNIEMNPTHLGLFVLNRLTGTPVTRLPVYAEVVWTEREPPPPPDERFDDSLFRALTLADEICMGSAACRAKVVSALRAALASAWPKALRDQLARDNTQQTIDLLATVIQRAREIAGVETLDEAPPNRLAAVLDQALREEADRLGIPADPARKPPTALATYPLGVLASDHVGYLSFDLKRLPPEVMDSVTNAMQAARTNAGDTTEAEIWVYPFSAASERFEALAQQRYTRNAIVMRLEFDPPETPAALNDLGLPAMQNPGLTDWYLSPASFVANPAALLGQDGCEQLFPAQLALQEYFFHQVVGLSDLTLPAVTSEPPTDLRAGFVQEYRTVWYGLGHSLGRILYSLPLAPGESVNLAVIDWRREDKSKRDEQTTVAETLTHRQTRDRTITEAVTAAIDEWQHGGDVMGGIGASFGAGAFGASAALGGGYSTSSGSRDLAANTVQKLSDNIAQASSSFRELNSTVVIETTQTEKEAIETRTVVNYNHAHTLTVLYYEVLRHFRVLTEFVRRRPAVLVKARTDWFTDSNADQSIREHRAALEAALLDPKYAEGFNAIERIAHRRQLAAITAPPSPPTPPPVPPPPSPADLRFFVFDMQTGGMYADESGESVQISATIWPAGIKLNNGPFSPPGAFTQANANNSFVGKLPPGKNPIPWAGIDMVEIEVDIFKDTEAGKDVSFQHIKVTGINGNGNELVLVDKSYADGHLILGADAHVILPTRRPPPAPPRPAAEIEDDAKKAELLAHLKYHGAHYRRAILLGQGAAEREKVLDAIKLADGSAALEHVENRPLAFVGDYVAYACIDPVWSNRILDSLSDQAEAEPPADERLISFPTRGVFGEGKLGHCNVSEEIDNTRFWDWQKSPIPHFAPAIAPIQGVTPTVQTPNLQPSAFPASLVNIVNPPAAPDPHGLGAALQAIATPEIFRDMSGRKEVAALLQSLAEGTMDNVAAQNKAKDIRKKYGADLLKPPSVKASGGTPGNGSSGGGGGAGISAADANDRRKVLEAMERSGEVSPEQAQEGYEQLGEQVANPAPTPGAPRPPNPKPLKPQHADKLPKDGLNFIIQATTVRNTTPSGTISATVYGLKEVEEFKNKRLVAGGVELNAKHVNTAGRIWIAIDYEVNRLEDVVADVFDKAGTGLPVKQWRKMLQNAVSYSLPKNGNLVMLDVKPHVEKRTKKATSASAAADKVSGEIGINAFVLTVNMGGESGTTTQTGDEVEWTVYVLTGGLDIEQRK